MSNDSLQQAFNLYQSGDKKQDCEVLKTLIQHEPGNANAWYGLAICVDEESKKRYCLEKVLAIDPGHQKAHQLMDKISAIVDRTSNKDRYIYKDKRTDKFLQKLTSNKTQERFEGCEWLRVGVGSSPEIVLALEKATQDEDEGVRERARAALNTEIHQQMAVKMGRIAPKAQLEEKQSENSNKTVKKCPYCAEEIKAEAIVCKHCGRDLQNHEGSSVSSAAPAAISGEKISNGGGQALAWISVICAGIGFFFFGIVRPQNL